MSDPIAEAITEHWGERCLEFYADCLNCQAWSAYDDLVERREQIERLTRENEALRAAAEPFMLVLERDISPDEADADRFLPMLRYNKAPHVTVGDFRRLATAAKEG